MNHRQHRRMTQEYRSSLEQINKHPTLKTAAIQREDPHTPLVKEVPFGKKPTKKEKKIDFLNRFSEGFNNIATDKKISVPKPTQRDRARIISAQVLEAGSLDVMTAFKNKKPFRSGNYATDGQKLKLFGKTIAIHSEGGLKVTNAGYDTITTYRALNQLGVEAKVEKGQIYINKQPYKHGTFVNVPYKDVSAVPLTGHFQKKNVNIQEELKQRAFNRRMVETRDYRSETAIQPQDQRKINMITGVHTKIPKPVRGTIAHHILHKGNFPTLKYPALRYNPNNITVLDRLSHSEAHRFDRLNLKAKLAALRSSTNSVVNRLNLLKRRSKKVRMAQDNPLVERVVSSFNKTKMTNRIQSLFIDQRGDIRSSGGTHYDAVREHASQLGIKLRPDKFSTAKEPLPDMVDDEHIHEFLQKTGMVRLQHFPNRQLVSVHVANKLTPNQLKTIQNLEKDDPNTQFGYGVGPDFNNMDFGNGLRNFMGEYRKHFGERSAQVRAAIKGVGTYRGYYQYPTDKQRAYNFGRFRGVHGVPLDTDPKILGSDFVKGQTKGTSIFKKKKPPVGREIFRMPQLRAKAECKTCGEPTHTTEEHADPRIWTPNINELRTKVRLINKHMKSGLPYEEAKKKMEEQYPPTHKGQAEGETNVFNMTYDKSKPRKTKRKYYGDKV